MRRTDPNQGRSPWSALFVFACGWLLVAAALPVPAAVVVQVERALDGDSLLLADGSQVRLIGINTPEFGKEGKPNQPLARAARDRLNGVTRGRTVRLVHDREPRDRHRRLLAYAFSSDGTDLQEMLLREGLAWYVAVPPNDARLPQYRRAEKEAREARRGIWALPDYEPLAAEAMATHHAGFQRVSGNIGSARRTKSGIEARLSRTVKVVIAPAIAASLGETPQSLLGKRILARGWVTEYKGHLRLRVAHPAMLEELR